MVAACLAAPAAVVQSSWNIAAAVIGDVVAEPLALVLGALREVKSAWSGLEMTQDCMPLVIQPRSEVPFIGTVRGLATRMMEGRETCTEHWAPAVLPWSVQVSEYVAVLAPAGGLATVVDAVPEGCEVTAKPVLDAVPEEQEYEMASVMPTSASWGWQESVAVGGVVVAVLVVGMQSQRAMQVPL